MMAKLRLLDLPGTVDLKFLVADQDRHGNVRLYVRRHQRKVRLRETPGSDAFLEEYRTALARLETNESAASSPLAPAPRGSFRWLCQRYYQSAEFKMLDPRTQHVRHLILDAFNAKLGDKPFASMEPKHVRRWRDARVETPEAANNLVKALRQVYAWALEADECERNPAAAVPYIRTGSQGWHTWTLEEVHQYLDHHGRQSRAGRALIFLLFTGAARCDVVKLGRQHCRKGKLIFKRQKTGVPVKIPILLELQAAIDATPACQLTFIVTEFSRPFTPAGFGNKMRDWCNQAGLRHCTAHGLRKAGATIAVENGAGVHQLMAIFFGGGAPARSA